MSAEPRFPGDLDEYEIFWRDHAAWLKDLGYQLRPRYRPEWKPSWTAKKTRDRYKYEDAQEAKVSFSFHHFVYWYLMPYNTESSTIYGCAESL